MKNQIRTAPNSPRPRRLAGAIWLVMLLVPLLALRTAHGQLTREQAANALLDPGSGVVIDLTNSIVWSPFVDFGFGPGFEGLLPAGSTVDPMHGTNDPLSGAGMTVTGDSYFFWIDDEPMAMFRHDTRFVLVNAAHSSPSVSNGGIVVTPQGWWPLIALPGGATNEFFGIDLVRTSGNAAGFNNPQGLVAGVAPDPSLVQPPAALVAATLGAAATQVDSNACALIVRGAPDAMFGHDVEVFERDLKNHFGVLTNRILKVNNGQACTFEQMHDAITALCDLQPPCKKIYLRITTHGTTNKLQFVSSFSTNFTLVDEFHLGFEFRRLAAKGRPICMLINACHSGSLLDPHDWGFAPGSSIITIVHAGTTGYGGGYIGSPACLYVTAHSQCLNSPVNPDIDLDGNGFVDDCEAHEWVKRERPGFTWYAGGPLHYPAGPPTGDPGKNPAPQKRSVGTSPFGTVATVCNLTGSPKTDYHIFYDGNVTNVQVGAARSSATGASQPGPWAAAGTTITYDPTNDTTMVCWEDTNDVIQAGQCINVRVFRKGGGLRPMGHFWTPTTTPPAPLDLAPVLDVDFSAIGTNGVATWATAQTNGVQTNTFIIRFSTMPIPGTNFHRGDAILTNLPAFGAGTFVTPPDQRTNFSVTVPMMTNAPLPTFILESDNQWGLSSNATYELRQFKLPTLPADTERLTNCPGSTSFLQVNPPPGPVPGFQWYAEGFPIAGETNDTLVLKSVGFDDAGTYTGVATNNGAVKVKYFDLAVEDFTSPQIVCPSNIVVEAASPDGMTVGFGVSAGDSCGVISTIGCDPPPGSLFPPGVTTVTCTVTDSAGNSSECCFTVNVLGFPPGDVNGDTRVNGSDSLLINQVLVNLRSNTHPIFAVTGFANGDVNRANGVTGVDSLLINQALVQLRSYLVTRTVPNTRSATNAPTAITIFGVRFPTGTVMSASIGAPVSLTLSNVVAESAEQITAIVPAGGGSGTGTVSVSAFPSNSVVSFGTFVNP